MILLKISLLFPKIPGYSKIEFSECWRRWMTACSDQAGHCVSSRILHVSIINALPKAASMFAIRQGLRARLNSAEITVRKTFMRSSARTWIPHCISVLVAMELIVSMCVCLCVQLCLRRKEFCRSEDDIRSILRAEVSCLLVSSDGVFTGLLSSLLFAPM